MSAPMKGAALVICIRKIVKSNHLGQCLCVGHQQKCSYQRNLCTLTKIRLRQCAFRRGKYWLNDRSASLHMTGPYCSQNQKRVLVLGIETSCDDTGAAVVDNHGNIIGEAIASQTKIHSELGGIIPPIARNLHRQNIDDVVKGALSAAGVKLEDLDAIATTVKPGLPLSLSVGLEYTKGLLRHSRKPFIPIHHMQAHALTARMVEKVEFPFLVLLISGGHCLLAVARSVEDFLILGSTLDDAPGDAFDKTARVLRLKNLQLCRDMSGGQAIEAVARNGDPRALPLIPVLSKHANCDFSFAGLKFAIKKYLKIAEREKSLGPDGVLENVADVCASFQYWILHHLAKRVQRALLYCEITKLLPDKNKTLVVSGGVASNLFIRQGLQKMCQAYDCQLVCPPPKLCTDNGVMIAWNGMEKLQAGIGIEEDWENVEIMAKWPMGEDISAEVAAAHIKLKTVKLI